MNESDKKQSIQVGEKDGKESQKEEAATARMAVGLSGAVDTHPGDSVQDELPGAPAVPSGDRDILQGQVTSKVCIECGRGPDLPHALNCSYWARQGEECSGGSSSQELSSGHSGTSTDPRAERTQTATQEEERDPWVYLPCGRHNDHSPGCSDCQRVRQSEYILKRQRETAKAICKRPDITPAELEKDYRQALRDALFTWRHMVNCRSNFEGEYKEEWERLYKLTDVSRPDKKEGN